ATKLNEEFPGLRSYQQLLADAKTQVAMCYVNLRRPAEAEQWAVEGVDLLVGLVRAGQRDALSHSMLLQELPRLLGLHVKNQSFGQALPVQHTIADALHQLAEQFPDERDCQQALVDTYGFLAALHLRLGQGPQAEQYYGRQRDLLEALAKPSVD